MSEDDQALGIPRDGITDDWRRNWVDICFIRERIAALGPDADDDATEETFRRAVLDILRGGTPSALTASLVANELERLWWPQSKSDQNLEHEQFLLSMVAQIQDDAAAAHREEGKSNPRELGKADAAKALGINTESLDRRRRRLRKRLKRRQT